MFFGDAGGLGFYVGGEFLQFGNLTPGGRGPAALKSYLLRPVQLTR